jgi:arabinogalactan endo-1,4-beta-galactosidase
MEADGQKFYNADGIETDIFALMKEIGMSAIRLRVWVNPTKYGYGAWCDKADVIVKAKRAHEQGLDLMIDFHYSDFFADPKRQDTPLEWKDYDLEQLKTAVADHTKDVLQALKDEGIEPKWVQVGNETNGGMMWENGNIDWNKSGKARYANYVSLSNAGYDAVKEILPDAYVIVHIADAFKAADYQGWFYKEFKEAGGKFDMIGLSHYPDWTDWDSDKSDAASNKNAANSVKTLGDLFNVPVMIVETGFSSYDPTKGAEVMTDLFSLTKDLPQCAGIFYWEPETDGEWKPAYYDTLGWNAYEMGAFTTDGKPTIILDAFKDETTGIANIITETDSPAKWFDLQGRELSAPSKGLFIMKKGSTTRKVFIP